MIVVYVAHPVRAIDGETIDGNLAAAKAWIKRLTEEHYPERCFVAPWITECEIWDDSSPDERAAGLDRCHAVIARCDELWMVGPRVSDGMRGERGVAVRKGLRVREMITGAEGAE